MIEIFWYTQSILMYSIHSLFTMIKTSWDTHHAWYTELYKHLWWMFLPTRSNRNWIFQKLFSNILVSVNGKIDRAVNKIDIHAVGPRDRKADHIERLINVLSMKKEKGFLQERPINNTDLVIWTNIYVQELVSILYGWCIVGKTMVYCWWINGVLLVYDCVCAHGFLYPWWVNMYQWCINSVSMVGQCVSMVY